MVQQGRVARFSGWWDRNDGSHWTSVVTALAASWFRVGMYFQGWEDPRVALLGFVAATAIDWGIIANMEAVSKLADAKADAKWAKWTVAILGFISFVANEQQAVATRLASPGFVAPTQMSTEWWQLHGAAAIVAGAMPLILILGAHVRDQLRRIRPAAATQAPAAATSGAALPTVAVLPPATQALEVGAPPQLPAPAATATRRTIPKAPAASISERRKALNAAIAANPATQTQDLADRFGVSTDTVFRDAAQGGWLPVRLDRKWLWSRRAAPQQDDYTSAALQVLTAEAP